MLYYEMMLHGDDGALSAVATVLRNPMYNNTADRVFGTDNCRAAMEVLRAIPTNMAYVSVYYPALDRRVIVNANPFGDKMDLSHIYAQREENKASDLPVRLVAPAMNVIPNDELIEYALVNTIADVQAAPKGAVLLFPESAYELLAVVVDHPTLFEFSCMVLSGLPTADYDSQFESRTYALERVAYASFVNELVEQRRVSAALKEESETPYQKERKQFTRADGSVKELTKHTVAGQPDKVEQDEAGE